MEIVYQKDRGVKLTPVVKGKSEKVKSREIKKLQQQFPQIEERVIRVVYSNSQCDLETSANSLLDMVPASQPVTYSFLFDMFPELDREYIAEVYESCGADLSKATAFILQTTCPEIAETLELTAESGFGNDSIGFVNSAALTKRLNSDYLVQLTGIFPKVDEDQIAAVLTANQGELLPTIRELEHLFGDEDESPGRESQQKVVPIPAKGSTYDQKREFFNEHFPSLVPTGPAKPQSHQKPASRPFVANKPQKVQSCALPSKPNAWTKYSDNYFLDGSSPEAVEKLKRLQLLFPAADSDTIKSIFFQSGDNMSFTIQTLKEYGFAQAKEATDFRVSDPRPPPVPQEPDEPEQPREVISPQRISDRDYTRMMEEMQRQRQLMELYFQTASKMAAAQTWQQAKKLSEEGRTHQLKFEELYRRTFRETFRRTNMKGDNQSSIDLHGLRMQEALDILDEYLDQATAAARMNGATNSKLEVITGRGVHSVRNIPILKPAVEKHLRALGLRFSELEGGFLVNLT